MSAKRWMFSWRECECSKHRINDGYLLPPALVVEETQEPCGWVRYSDYADLEAEVKRLRNGVKTIEYHADGVYRFVSAMEYDRLKAENERLRKAGDAMAEHFEGFSEWNENADGSPYVSSRLKAWLAAKEGGRK